MDLTTYDPDRQDREFHRDAAARALALVTAFRGEAPDVPGWKVLTDDLMLPLPPEGHPLRAAWAERQRRQTAVMLALASLSSRLMDLGLSDPDAWLEDQHDEIVRRSVEDGA